jgi:hypothetical protein
MKSFFSSYKSWQKISIVVCILFIVIANVLVALNNSVTWDETCYIGAGKYILKNYNFKYNALGYHPPLAYYINSVFLFPIKFSDKAYSTDNCWINSREIIFNSGIPSSLLVFLARLPFILISIAFAFYILIFAKDLNGNSGSIVSLYLYSFSASILSFSNLVYTDFLSAFLIFVTIFYFWKYNRDHKTRNLILTGVFFGLAQLSKMTSLILFLLLTVLSVCELLTNGRLNKKNLFNATNKLALIFSIGFIILWAGYGFTIGPVMDFMPEHYVNKVYQDINDKFSDAFIRDKVLFIFEKMPVPMPAYFFGLSSVIKHSSEGGKNFLNGVTNNYSKWYSTFAVIIYKTQISMLILFSLLIFFFYRYKKLKKIVNSDLLYVVFPMIFLLIFFVLAKMNYGLRHIIPIYPFVFLFVGQICEYIDLKQIIAKAFLALILLHYALCVISIMPFPLAYFNEIAKGPDNGYVHLVDSNLDLGQNLIQLREYMEINKIAKINFSYFGSVDPRFYGISYNYMTSPAFEPWIPGYQAYQTSVELEDCSLKKGWIAISATNLQGVFLKNTSCYNWLRNYEPVSKIGYSIFIYHIS